MNAEISLKRDYYFYDINIFFQRIYPNIEICYNLTSQEKEFIMNSPIAHLIAALPFFAGCKNPEQLAVLKIGMYIAGLRNPQLFCHRENQEVRERLLPGVICPDGDETVINLITDFLELISINDHIHDLEIDK